MTWQPHPDAWVLVVALGGGYLLALRVWGAERPAGTIAAARGHRVLFFSGLAALWLGADWPTHQLTASWFSAHMVQHLLFSLVAAPLMILGVPGWLWRRLLAPRPVNAAWRVLTRPLVALIAYNAWTAGYHWPPIVNLSVSSDAFHLLVHVVWVGVSLVMWWPVLSPLPEMGHLSYPARMAYLFGQSLLPTIPASFLTFGEGVLYRVYEHAPRVGGLDPMMDQQIAGLIMKVGAGFLLWSVIAWLFFRWQHEEQSGGPDLLYWRDLRHDLGPTPASPPLTPTRSPRQS